MNILRQYIRYSLSEKALRGQKDKRTLYHINLRPARPQPKVKMMQQWDDQIKDRFGDKGDFVDVPDSANWQRYWLDSPVKSGVFLTPNPLDIAMNHGRSGNVYAYKVPEWVIDKSGGMHRYDNGSEVLIPEDVWNEAGDEIEFLGKTMEQKQLWDKMDSSMFGRGHHRRETKNDPEAPEQLGRWKGKEAPPYSIWSLRSTKYPESAIKMMKPAEVEGALAAFEKKYPQEGPAELYKGGPRDKKGIVVPFFGRQPDKKDEELIAMLKKRQDESVVRGYIREMLLTEISLGLKPRGKTMESILQECIMELLVEEVKFSGILKVMPDANVIASVLTLADQLPPEAVMLPEDRLHVTLAHQSVLKPYRKQLKQLSKDGMLPPAPPVIIEPALEERVDEAEGKKSWVIWVRNQDELKAYIQEVIQMVGGPPGDPEPSRRFHISIANLTGNPGDSVR